MSTFIDDGDDEDGVTDPPLNTTFSVASGTLQEAFVSMTRLKPPPPEPIPDGEGGDCGAPHDPNDAILTFSPPTDTAAGRCKAVQGSNSNTCRMGLM